MHFVAMPGLAFIFHLEASQRHSFMIHGLLGHFFLFSLLYIEISGTS